MNPVKQSAMEFSASQRISGPLKVCITQQIPEIPFEAWEEQNIYSRGCPSNPAFDHAPSAGGASFT